VSVHLVVLPVALVVSAFGVVEGARPVALFVDYVPDVLPTVFVDFGDEFAAGLLHQTADQRLLL
jgi:hypothetical protein